MRYSGLIHKSYCFRGAYYIFTLNILEAMVTSFDLWSLAGYANGLAGLFLILALPWKGVIKIDIESKNRNFLWDIPLSWIAGYTIWNLIFTYIYFNKFGVHFSILSICLLISFWDRSLWVQSRGFTLAFALMLDLTFPKTNSIFNISIQQNTAIDTLLGFISLAFNFSLIALKKKTEKVPKKIFSDFNT